MGERRVRLVLPHQLFLDHLDAPRGTTFVLLEHDLLFRQYRFHVQKLVLHRASMKRFAERLEEAGFPVRYVETDGRRRSRTALAQVLDELDPTEVTAYDVVDDWLGRDLAPVVTEWLETPNFLTDRPTLKAYFGDGTGRGARMGSFYSWQRQRLEVLVEGGDQPVGGKWSFDEENRKKLPKGHPVPDVSTPARHPQVEEAIAWVGERFPDSPGNVHSFAWPTSHEEAEAGFGQFLAERFDQFGPYEDAVSAEHPFVFHSVITPGLNVGLLRPQDVLHRALAVDDVPLASLEGFVRQVIGWREYMRATYVLWGRRMRTTNQLGHTRTLDDGWWDASTGLAPVDLVIERVLERGYAHHIERLMVIGNAMCLLRIDPDAAYEWFMELFVDAYDWVMVPNVYAMSQFAAGTAITTKPYVSGSNYLRKMSDLPPGEWREDWDALYWTFIRDHREVFATNPRSRMVANLYDGMAPGKKAQHTRRAQRWLAS
jgi:deoxyribodipyrimidine photolyase-related protein